MTVPYMKKPDPSDTESLALVNDELRKRLYRAAVLLKKRNQELRDLKEGNLAKEDAPQPQDDEALLREVYGYEGTEEYLELTGKISELEVSLHRSETKNMSLQGKLDKNLKGAEMKEAELREIILNVRTETRRKDRTITQLKNSLRRMSEGQEDSSMSHQLTISAMHLAGVEAQLAAFRKEHPNSDLLLPMNPDKDPHKSALRSIYEEAFDNKGSEMGVSTPSVHRAPKVKSPT